MPRLAFVAALAVAPLGCFGGTGLFSFPVDRSIDEQVVQGSPVPVVLPGFQIPFQVDLAAETSARSTGPAQHVYLTSLTLDITATEEPVGDSDDFDFIDRLEVFVESTKAGTTLPRRRIAFLDPTPNGVRRLDFDLDDVDLIDYVNEGARLTTEGTGTLPPDDVSFDGAIALSVEVL